MADLNAGDEDFAFDNVEITGTPTTGNPIVGFDSASSAVAEGADGIATTHDVAVTMNTAPAAAVVVTINSADGTATTADNDYNAVVNETLTFTATETYPNTKNVTVTINGDDMIEDDEDFTLNLTVPAGADAGTTTHTVNIANDDFPPIPDIVINEIHADPSNNGLDGDANGDGINDSSDDEFLEFINFGTSDIDISGWTISDAVQVRHTFAANTVIPPNQGIVVFGGGTPTGIPAQTDVASTGLLGLNNGGDNVIVADAFGIEIINETYGSDAGDNQSLGRDPDITGPFVKHTTIDTGNGFAAASLRFSPGQYNVSGAALPVVLSSFTAEAQGRATDVAWTTASEAMNSHFEIQHSVDNRNFTTLEKITGAGDSAIEIAYDYTHKTPAQGVNYYRLQQFDFDGQSSYSRVVSVRFGAAAGMPILFPNPVSEILTVSFDKELSAEATAEVINQSGSVVLRSVFAEKSLTQEVNLTALPAGIYFLRIVNGNEVTTERFVKK